MVAGTRSKEAIEEGLHNTDSRVQELMNSHHHLQKTVEDFGDKFGHLQSTMEMMMAEFQRTVKGKGSASTSGLHELIPDSPNHDGVYLDRNQNQ